MSARRRPEHSDDLSFGVKDASKYLAPVMACTMLSWPHMATAQTATGIPPGDHHAGQNRDPHRDA